MRGEHKDPTLAREQLIFDAHKKALNTIADARIDMHLFADMYTKGAVDRDLAEVERLKNIFKQEETPETKLQKRQADILEAIILEQMELSNWFGEDVITRAASEFDDLINGTDMFALFDVEGKATASTGFAIDVTFSKYTQKKLQRIKREITSGRLPSLRYVLGKENDDTGKYDFQGTVSDQPRIILAMSEENLLNIAQTWVHGKRNALANHPMKMQFASQIYTQLQTYREYARRQGKRGIADIYDRQFRIWKGVLEEQNYFEGLDNTPEARTFFENDPTHTALMQATGDMLL